MSHILQLLQTKLFGVFSHWDWGGVYWFNDLHTECSSGWVMGQLAVAGNKNSASPFSPWCSCVKGVLLPGEERVYAFTPVVPAIMRHFLIGVNSKKLQCQLWPFLPRTMYSWLSSRCAAQSVNATLGSTGASLQLHQPALLWSCVVAVDWPRPTCDSLLHQTDHPSCTKLERESCF